MIPAREGGHRIGAAEAGKTDTRTRGSAVSRRVRAAVARARRARAGGLQVVLYHHFSDRSSDLADRLQVTTPPSLFEAHLRRLVHEYDVVDLEAVLTGRLPRKPLLITFDDGYRSVLDVAGPLLARHGIPSVFFVSSAFVMHGSLPLDNLLCWLSHRVALEDLETAVTGRPPTARSFGQLVSAVADLGYERRERLEHELAERFEVDLERLRAESGLFLDSSELGALSELGVEIGNHTRSHLHCRAIVDEAAARRELVEHRHVLERWTDTPCRSFSYPYGSARDASPFVQKMLAASGHEAVFLVESRPNGRRAGDRPWSRVSLRDKPVSRLYVELEVLPRLRAARDRFP